MSGLRLIENQARLRLRQRIGVPNVVYNRRWKLWEALVGEAWVCNLF